MEIHEWNKRYRLREHETSDFESPPTPLLVETIAPLAPGSALDLACGAGRNALWLAEHGWQVTAVDGSSVAIETLRDRAAERNLPIAAVVADLEKHEFEIERDRWDLIAICYYLQPNLFEPAKRGVKPGGILIAIVHITEPGQAQTRHSLRPGELEAFFKGWEILHRHEGIPTDKPHRRPVAELVARRPPLSIWPT
ncbi:MAG: methyltransferase domain-containing protein [Acidobacteriia bacterium]|nr:methyltransferase domain-containing protein [Terriglobia bacterium]